jgi:hypothetical protein
MIEFPPRDFDDSIESVTRGKIDDRYRTANRDD